MARRACPKCGGRDLVVRYVEAGGDRWHLPRADERCREAAEHLHWTCVECRYHWSGPPQDARGRRADMLTLALVLLAWLVLSLPAAVVIGHALHRRFGTPDDGEA